ncbi:MAG TPA: PH domain-containing protein [Phycisphaerae bacterium]|nr:PH domain-containing protein [Phycisphaerae bacterium]
MTPTPESAAPSLAEESVVPAGLLDDGESIVLAVRPSGWFVVLASWPIVVPAVLAGVGAYLLAVWLSVGLPYRGIAMFCGAAVVVRVIVACFQWLGRLYLLTNRRLMWIQGVMRFDVRQCPLRNVRAIHLSAGVGERLLGLGSLLFLTAGEEAPAGAWINLARPVKVRQAIEEAVRRCGGRLED